VPKHTIVKNSPEGHEKAEFVKKIPPKWDDIPLKGAKIPL